MSRSRRAKALAAGRGRRLSGRLSHAQAGFSLFETLVALMIASIAASAMILCFSLAARSMRQAEETVGAALAARSIMDRLRLQFTDSGNPALAGVEGVYRWRATITQVELPPFASSREPAQPEDQSKQTALVLYKVSLVVQSPSGRQLDSDSLVAGKGSGRHG